MFEETAKYREHPNVFRYTGQPGSQAAYASNHQINENARLRRPVKGPDDFRFNQSINSGNDVSCPAIIRILNLRFYMLDDLLMQIER